MTSRIGIFGALSLTAILAGCDGSDTPSGTSTAAGAGNSGATVRQIPPAVGALARSGGDPVSIPAPSSGGTSSTSSGGSTGSTSSPGTSTRDAVPTISGTPAKVAAVGSAYRFTPTVQAAAGARLTFSVANRPAWARFDPATGTLQGSPNATNVGKTQAIVISVSDGAKTAVLGAFSIDVTEAASGMASLSWTAPTKNANGSKSTNLAGYHIYYGTSAGSLSHVVVVSSADETNYVIDKLSSGTWYFAITAFNSENIESGLSAVVPIAI